MIEISPQPDLQCLLWIFTKQMKKMTLRVDDIYKKGSYFINIRDDDTLNTHRAVLSSLCLLLSYCYEKKFVVKNEQVVSTCSYTRPTLETNDIVVLMFRKWNEHKSMPTITI